MGETSPKFAFLFFVVIFLALFTLPACESYIGGPIPKAEVVTISGKLNEMPLMTPVAGAVVEMIANNLDTTVPNPDIPCECSTTPCEYRTVTDSEGHWVLENLPITYNPLTAMANSFWIRVTAEGYPPAYNLFTLAFGNESDLMTLPNLFFILFALEDIIAGADPAQLNIMMGASIGFASTAYPPVTASLAGVTALAKGGDPTEELPIVYLGEEGLPDPELNATSSMGAFYYVVPDARDSSMPLIDLTGTKPGKSIVGGYYPACPGSFVPVGLIDPYYRPVPLP